MSFKEEYADYLAHYGVKGMRWGVRKDRQRYGLNEVKFTKEEQKLLDSLSAEEQRAKIDPTYNYKKDRKRQILQDVLETMTLYRTPAGIYHIITHNNDAARAKRLLKKSNEIRSKSELDDKTGLLKKTVSLSEKDELKMVNPSFNPIDESTTTNCTMCCMAMDMRRRGFEVRARKTTVGVHSSEIKKVYKNAKIAYYVPDDKDANFLSKNDISEITNSLLKEGGHGFLSQRYHFSNMGHHVYYEVKNDNLRIIDAQSGKIVAPNIEKANDYLKYAYQLSIARTDNCEVNYNQVKKYIE